jgi:hypothetical protein
LIAFPFFPPVRSRYTHRALNRSAIECQESAKQEPAAKARPKKEGPQTLRDLIGFQRGSIIAWMNLSNRQEKRRELRKIGTETRSYGLDSRNAK